MGKRKGNHDIRDNSIKSDASHDKNGSVLHNTDTGKSEKEKMAR